MLTYTKVIITGPKGIGKTTFCSRLAIKLAAKGISVGGVLSERDEEGYVARNISTGDTRIMVGVARTSMVQVGVKLFMNPKGIDMGMRAINASLTDFRVTIVDEVGLLEMKRGMGLMPAATQAVEAETSVVFVVRESLVPRFRGVFPKTEFELVTLSNERSEHDKQLDSVLEMLTKR